MSDMRMRLYLPTKTRPDFGYEYFDWPEGFLGGEPQVMLFARTLQFENVLLPSQGTVEVAERILGRPNVSEVWASPFNYRRVIKVAGKR